MDFIFEDDSNNLSWNSVEYMVNWKCMRYLYNWIVYSKKEWCAIKYLQNQKRCWEYTTSTAFFGRNKTRSNDLWTPSTVKTHKHRAFSTSAMNAFYRHFRNIARFSTARLLLNLLRKQWTNIRSSILQYFLNFVTS